MIFVVQLQCNELEGPCSTLYYQTCSPNMPIPLCHGTIDRDCTIFQVERPHHQLSFHHICGGISRPCEG